MTTDKMLSRNDNGVGYITFNNPEKHNAVSIEMWDELVIILNNFKQNKDIRVIVLNGAGGKSFVSGADISKFDKERSSKEAILNYNKRTQKVYELL
jgi:enoyl-CoA hydratase